MIVDFKSKWYIGSVVKINNNSLVADIKVFDNCIQKDCIFFGIHCSEIKVGDDVLVLMLSRELFLYTPLRIDSFLGLKKGTNVIDLTTPSTIHIKADKVIVDSKSTVINSLSIKLGSEAAIFTPIVREDLPNIPVVVNPLTGVGNCQMIPVSNVMRVKVQ